MVMAKYVTMLKSVDSLPAKPATIAQSGLVWLWLSVISLIADQLTKTWIIANFKLHESVAVMPMFNLVYARNEGAAFSFLSDAGGWQRWFFTAIALSISGLLIYWLRGLHRSAKLLSIAYALVLSGALGNLIDRLMYGYVVDFLDFYYQNSHWPAFNIADMAICGGAMLIIYDAITSKEQETK